MKKTLLGLAIFSILIIVYNTPAYAMEDDIYNESEIEEIMGFGKDVDINGCIKSKGNVDYHLIPPVKNSTSAVSAATGLSVIMLAAAISDPYMIKIDGTTYIFVKDNHDGVWNYYDILGYTDKPDDLFESLRNLCPDNSQKVTPADLRRNGVRLVPLQENGKLYVKDTSKDYNLDNIDYIDLSKLRKLASSSNVGVFGHYKMKLKDKRTLTGYVTYNSDNKLQNLFE